MSFELKTEFDIYANERLDHFCFDMGNTPFHQNVRKSLLLLAIYEEFRSSKCYIWKNGEITDKPSKYSDFLYMSIKNWQY